MEYGIQAQKYFIDPFCSSARQTALRFTIHCFLYESLILGRSWTLLFIHFSYDYNEIIAIMTP